MALPKGRAATSSILYDNYGSKIDSIVDTENGNVNRLQVESLISPGSSINVGAAIPSDPGLIFANFLTESGGSEDMLVDGSSTPVEFKIEADATRDLVLSEFRFVYGTDDMVFDGSSFGPKPKLTNGILADIQVNDGETANLINVQLNEDLLRFVSSAGINILLNNTGPKDIAIASFNLGGNMSLKAGTSDFIRVTIRDNLIDVKQKYLTGTVYGVFK